MGGLKREGKMKDKAILGLLNNMFELITIQSERITILSERIDLIVKKEGLR